MMSENTFSANTAEISGKPAGFMTRQKTLLRHRLWLPAMILLSYFICYVIYPWLMFANEGASVAERIYRAQQILGYNNFAVLMLTTIFAAVLGIQGYAYLHQRQMVDFYEAQPLKRNKRFWDIYVNSVLIWFICFLVMSAAGLGICAM